MFASGQFCCKSQRVLEPEDALRTEFIKYVLSKEGQERTIEGRFYPINNEMRQAELNKLGIAKPK
jgi:hypothetical protein